MAAKIPTSKIHRCPGRRGGMFDCSVRAASHHAGDQDSRREMRNIIRSFQRSYYFACSNFRKSGAG
jgi:hypothetical protein